MWPCDHNHSNNRWTSVFSFGKTVKALATKCATGKSCLMFMFRSKRTALAKRLWKARIRREHEAGSEAKASDSNENRDPRCFSNTDERSLRNDFLKKLKEDQLERLAVAVESGDSGLSRCVMLPRSLVEEPHLKCCQTWRWPDLRQPQELKQLPVCQQEKDPEVVCCNPFHWSRICKPGKYCTNYSD